MSIVHNLATLQSARLGKVSNDNWDQLVRGEYLLLSKADGHGNVHWWYGTVEKVERLRNCQRLQLKVLGWWVNTKPYRKQFDPVQTFNNRSHPEIFFVKAVPVNQPPPPEPPKTEKDRRREARKAAINARTMLKSARSEMHVHLELLGLGSEFTEDDLKRVRRNCMKTFHPDLKARWVAQGGKPEDFERKSEQMTVALSWADTYLKRKQANP